MKTVYGVPYIEVDFGERSEGYAIYTDLQVCIICTRENSASGAYNDDSGYYGPVRPLHYVEIPFDCLPSEIKKRLKVVRVAHTENHWSPPFQSERHYI